MDSGAIRKVSSPYLPSIRRKNFVDETETIGYDSTPVTTNRETVTPKERTFWTGLGEVVFGREIDASFYEENVGRVKKLDDIGEVAEREKALKENASWMLLKSKEVIDVVAKNKSAGRGSFKGLSYDMGIPMSPEQLVHTDGYSAEEQYHYNLLAYFLSKAVLENAQILASYDMDGTLTDKSLSPFATRRMQPISQIHQNRVSMNAGIEHLNMHVMINTARSLVQTIILANLEGPESKFTYAPHTEATEELVGFLLSDQCNILESIDIAAANGGVKSIKDGETYISDATLKSNWMIRKLGPAFVDKVFKKPAEAHENSDDEFKGLNRFMFDNKHVIGKVSFQHFKKIMQYWQEEVVNGKGELPQKLDTFRERVLNGITEEDKQYAVNEGVRRIPQLEVEIKGLTTDLQDCQQELEDLIIDKTDVEQLEQKERQAELLLRERIGKIEKELHEKKLECNRFIRLVGSELDNETTIEKERWNLVGKQVANHFELLEKDPEAYVRHITHGDPFGFCTHFFNSRGTPHEQAIKEVIDNLRFYQYDSGTRRDVRQLNNEFHEKSKKVNAEGKTEAEVNDEIDNFVKTGKLKFKNDGAVEYINWRFTQHVMFNYTKDELKNCNLFNLGNELTLKDEVKAEWNQVWAKSGKAPNQEALEYKNWLQLKLRSQLSNLPPDVGEYLARYLDDVLPQNYFEQKDLNVSNEYFMPDEFYARKGKNQYTGKDTLLAIFRLDEKSDSLRPEGQFYFEFLPLRGKDNVIPSFREFFLKRLTGISSGDTASDLPPHAAMIMRKGVARIIYSIINESDICEEIIKQQEKLVAPISNANNDNQKQAILQAALKELYIANKHFGIFGLEKNKDGTYAKVSVVKKGRLYEKVSSGSFSKQELLKEAEELCAGRVDKNRSPGHLICKTAELMEYLTGRRCKLDNEKFQLAIKLHEKVKKGIKLSSEEETIYGTYKSEVVELENASKLSIDAPRFRVFYEYYDRTNGAVYYRFKSDSKLYTKDGKAFEGDEKKLEQRAIKEDIHGVFVFEENGRPFDDPRLLNKLLVLESPLPAPSSPSGPFASKGLLKFFGLGNEEKGAQRLETFLTKLPNMFSTFLEACGGLMALGGVARLVAIPFAHGEESSIAKAGYWTSNVARACSAFGASMRGVLNVNRLWDVTAGEVINMFSALFLGNGAKHVGFAVGNIFLFTGRGLQAAQRAQRVNAPTEKEVKDKKLDENTIDPRPHVRDVVRFSLEGVVLPVKHAFQKAGMSGVVGEIFGRLTSAAVTPIKMTKDILANPSLVTQIQNRISEKSGAVAKLVPSNGHLMALTGVLSGVGAIVAGTFGRMDRAGEIAEHGFNSIGRWGVSLATSVAALGIISNGFEVAANTQGLPKIFRGLDGQDVKYSPKRAGLGQVFAGIGYAIVPLFGLHNDWVASLFDVTTGMYFGLPGTRSSVAQEEIPNSFNLAKSVLIEGQRFYTDGMINVDIDQEYEERSKKYVLNHQTNKYEYDPNYSLAV